MLLLENGAIFHRYNFKFLMTSLTFDGTSPSVLNKHGKILHQLPKDDNQ